MSKNKHYNKEEQEIHLKDTTERRSNQANETTLQADAEGEVQKEKITTETCSYRRRKRKTEGSIIAPNCGIRQLSETHTKGEG